MTHRGKLRVVITLAIALPLLAGAAFAAVVLGGSGDAARFRGSPPPPGIMLPDFALRDYTGKRILSRELRGKAVLITFLDTQCTESCPLIASQIGQSLDLLIPGEVDQVVAVAISTDPAEDTRASVRAFLRRHRVQGRLHYLVAAVDELRPVWNAFRISASFDTGVDSLHSAPVRIYDRGGTWVASQHAGADLSPENLAHDVRTVLEE